MPLGTMSADVVVFKSGITIFIVLMKKQVLFLNELKNNYLIYKPMAVFITGGNILLILVDILEVICLGVNCI